MKYSVILLHGFVLATVMASVNGYWKNKDQQRPLFPAPKQNTTTPKPLAISGPFKNGGRGKCLIQSDTQKTRKGNQPAWVWVDCDHTSSKPHLITTKNPVKTTMKPPMSRVVPQTHRPQPFPIPSKPSHPVPVPTRAPVTVRPQPPSPPPVRPPVPVQYPQSLPAPSPTSSRPRLPSTIRPPPPAPALVRPPHPVPVLTQPPATVRPAVSTARPQSPPTVRPLSSTPVRPPQPPASVKPPMSTSRPTTTNPTPVKYRKNTWTTAAPSLICNNRWCWDGKMWFEKAFRPTEKTVNIFKKPTLP